MMMNMMGMPGGPMPGGPMAMAMPADDPYAAEVVAVKQRIARLKDRLSQRAAARRGLLADKSGGGTGGGPSMDEQEKQQEVAASPGCHDVSACTSGTLLDD